MSREIFETELFEIAFSKTKMGSDKKFSTKEKNTIIEAAKATEETFSRTLSFSKIKVNGKIYRTPVIFEKVRKLVFEQKHSHHYAILSYPPIGSIWNKTVKFKGVEIKSKTAIISLCPQEDKDFFVTVSHELIHVLTHSFVHADGVNNNNLDFFYEGLTEWMAQLTSNKKKNLVKNS